jgi:hypothetical protein
MRTTTEDVAPVFVWYCPCRFSSSEAAPVLFACSVDFGCYVTRVATATVPHTEKLIRFSTEENSTILIQNVFSNLAKLAFQPKEVTSFGWIANLARLLLARTVLVTMVTNIKNASSLRKLAALTYFVTLTSLGDIGDCRSNKRAHLSSPMSPHAIQKLRAPADVRTQGGDGVRKEGDGLVMDYVDDKIEFDNDSLPFHIVDSVVDATTLKNEFNLLIPQSDVMKFIIENFVCKTCQSTIREQNIVVDRVGCVCNIFWTCAASGCQGKE